MVDFPLPETPMTSTTAGADGDASFAGRVCTDINLLVLAPPRDPQTNGGVQPGK